MGIEALCKEDSAEKLVELIRKAVFPHTEAEAKELFVQGQRPHGPLSRGHGESTLQYIARKEMVGQAHQARPQHQGQRHHDR